ncbi:MAG: hypothetical protein ACRDWT_08635 [Jatrophihabitantaceae bacterium]
MVAVIVVELVISLAARWPLGTGRHSDPHRMLGDFVSNGTALAPPLFIVIVLLVLAVGVQRSDRWGTATTVLLVPLAAVMAVGAAYDAGATANPHVPTAAQLVGGIVGAALSVLLLGLAIAALVTAHSGKPSASQAAIPQATAS